MAQRRHDTIAGVLIAAVCVAYLRGAQGFESPLVVDPLGPAAFPRILGWVGLLLAAALLASAWWGRAAAEGEEAAPIRRLVRPLLLFALLVGYALALEPAGYLPATLAFVVVSLLLLGEPAWRGCVVAIGFSGGFYLLFAKILKINLPAGTLFR